MFSGGWIQHSGEHYECQTARFGESFRDPRWTGFRCFLVDLFTLHFGIVFKINFNTYIGILCMFNESSISISTFCLILIRQGSANQKSLKFIIFRENAFQNGWFPSTPSQGHNFVDFVKFCVIPQFWLPRAGNYEKSNGFQWFLLWGFHDSDGIA